MQLDYSILMKIIYNKHIADIQFVFEKYLFKYKLACGMT